VLVIVDWIDLGEIAASGIPLSVQDLHRLCEQGIRAIVTLTEDPLTDWAGITSQILDEVGLTYLHAPINDLCPPDMATVWKVTQFINQMKAQDRPVLLHCFAGVGRTGTMLHAYYLAEGFSLEAARDKVRAHKPSSQFSLLSHGQRALLENFAAAKAVVDNLKPMYCGGI